VRGIYDYPHDIDFVTAAETRGARIKTFASLATLFVIDITPVAAFVIILGRPRWLPDGQANLRTSHLMMPGGCPFPAGSASCLTMKVTPTEILLFAGVMPLFHER